AEGEHVRLTGERLEMGQLVEPSPDGWWVRLDDGRELVVRIGNTSGLYQVVPGERVCMSVAPGQESELTGYLTDAGLYAAPNLRLYRFAPGEQVEVGKERRRGW